jgi:hypothetical protein
MKKSRYCASGARRRAQCFIVASTRRSSETHRNERLELRSRAVSLYHAHRPCARSPSAPRAQPVPTDSLRSRFIVPLNCGCVCIRK